MRMLTTAARLNAMIQDHIDRQVGSTYMWHSGVYLQTVSDDGCNWNIVVNCKNDGECGTVISPYLDELRSLYVIAEDDEAAVPWVQSSHAKDAA